MTSQTPGKKLKNLSSLQAQVIAQRVLVTRQLHHLTLQHHQATVQPAQAITRQALVTVQQPQPHSREQLLH